MKKGKKKDLAIYVMALFVMSSILVFAIVYVIILLPTILTKFGHMAIFIAMLVVNAVVASMLAILFYLLLKGDIKVN